MLKYKHNTFKRKFKVYTKVFYKNKWYVKRNKLLDENGKLRTYLKLKCNFGFENYLHILSDFNQRKSFTKFRISNHKLKIETGRYSKPITSLENRICEKMFFRWNRIWRTPSIKMFFLLYFQVPGASFLKQLRITLIILTLKNYHLGINLYGF